MINGNNNTYTENFQKWFGNSVAIDEMNNPLVVYHGSIAEFTVFDINKIRANETDAYYNGFWFTSEIDRASPAWVNPRYVNSYYISLQNPAPHKVVNEVYRNNYKECSFKNGFRSWADIVRFKLQELGYDGVIHNDKPKVNIQEFEDTGETIYITNRGFKYKLKKDTEWGGVDLYKIRYDYEDHLTGYDDLNSFLSQHNERVFVVFNPEQIKSINNIGTFDIANPDTLK